MNTLRLLSLFGCVAITVQCGTGVKPRELSQGPQGPRGEQGAQGAPETPGGGSNPPPCGCLATAFTAKNTLMKGAIADATNTVACTLPITCMATGSNKAVIQFDVGGPVGPSAASSLMHKIDLTCGANGWEHSGAVVASGDCIDQAPCACENSIKPASVPADMPLATIAMTPNALCQLMVSCESTIPGMETSMTLTPTSTTASPEMISALVASPMKNEKLLTCDTSNTKWQSMSEEIKTVGCKQECSCKTPVTATPANSPAMITPELMKCETTVTCAATGAQKATVVFNFGGANEHSSAEVTGMNNVIPLVCEKGNWVLKTDTTKEVKEAKCTVV